jgi:tetratricopeptide (TPR) repeat protein
MLQRFGNAQRAAVALTSFACSLTYAGSSVAQTSSSEALVEERRNDAKSKFEQGVEAYRAHRYDEAVRWFLAADRQAPSPALSFNIARAYERLNDTSGALRWYRDYLRRSPNAANAGDVRGRVAGLSSKLAEKGLQQLTVLSTPSGASVSIDGGAAGVTPFTGDLAPGVHRVTVTLAGYKTVESDVTLESDKAQDFSATLQPGTSASSARSPDTNASSEDTSGAAASDRPGPRRFGAVPWWSSVPEEHSWVEH